MSGSEPLPHERYYIHISYNTHNKRKLTLSKTANDTKTILKPIPMIFLLKNAPHSLPILYQLLNIQNPTQLLNCTVVQTNQT